MSERRAIAYIPARGAAQTSAEQGWKGSRLNVVGTVRAQQTGSAHGAIAEALRPLAEGEASVLLVARLSDAASSPRELIALLDWLEAAGCDLVALDVGLDSASPGGRRTVATLREVERWRHARAPGRPPRGQIGRAHV